MQWASFSGHYQHLKKDPVEQSNILKKKLHARNAWSITQDSCQPLPCNTNGDLESNEQLHANAIHCINFFCPCITLVLWQATGKQSIYNFLHFEQCDLETMSSLPPTPNQQISFRSLKVTAKQIFWYVNSTEHQQWKTHWFIILQKALLIWTHQ
jgi:hypothetical protein